ncbi:MAG TPA: formylglycine-generating enzyme family protein [Candidatus Competibacter sp.]|nr:formylglycine-generating enzyme family protein [Candidatus Competibacteraceae bacterium]HPE71873.1 formylglycine-generating enzyme family protein [Candidatus Competibacter sp.]HRW65874.1 formylglycine-generating enzyme family protein [Candidatus Competibacter sp.]
MPLDGRDRLAELGDFLAALRLNGVPVGPGEIERLRHLLEPEYLPLDRENLKTPKGLHLDRAGLKTLLGALLIKTPAQRQTFEGLFAAWCPDHEADWPEPAERPTAEPSRPEPPQPGETAPSVFELPTLPEPSRFVQWLPLALAGLLALATAIWALWPSAPITESQELPTQPIPTPPSADPELPDQPVNAVWSWRIDEITPESVRTPNRLGPVPLALLGATALTLALGMRWRYRRRFRVIRAKPQPYRGFGWQPLPPPRRDDGALIDTRTRRQLVWNIERFVADDPTRRLNLAKTVDETARAGGFVRLCFHSAVYERAIWFWLDRHLGSRTPREIAAQLGATLRAAGLDARQGFFTDVPHRVDWPEQAGYRPVTEESQGRQAQVAIFCDGAGLQRRLDHPLHQEETKRLLRSLQHWPRLCFVDCSPSGDQLSALFAKKENRFRLEVVTLEQLPDWLGGIETETAPTARADEGLFGPARQWAAGVALGGGQADAAAAHTLRAVLGLAASPWNIDRILAENARPETRRRLINWLLRGEPLADGTPRSDSLARRALDWWRVRHEEADRNKQDQENPLLPWQNSLASRRWQVEHALLRLYTEPEAAADRLAELADAELHAEIRDRLGEFAATDHRPTDRDDDGERIYLTWRFADRPAATRHRLRALGFAGGLFPSAPPPLKDAPRLVLASTLLVALALAAFAVAGYRWLTPDPPRLRVRDPIQNDPVLAAQTLRIVEPAGANHYTVTLGDPKAQVTLQAVPVGAEIPVNWRWAASGNPERLEGSDSVLLRAGSLAQPIRACGAGWPQRSLVVIAATYDADRAARQLAIRLLDKGSADQVLVGRDWAKHWREWRGASPTLNRNTQVLVILPPGRDRRDSDAAARLLADHPGPWVVVAADDLAALAKAVDFSGTKPVTQAALPWRVLETSGDARLYGGPETTRENGIEWVAICPGTFTMGSAKSEAMAYENEIDEPPRVVALSAFQIAATETTNRQYAQVVSDYKERDNRPVVNVTWAQVRSFCQQVGGDLPTEAQWEYAARGGSRTPWSFGDDESQLGRYAWFNGNSDGQTHEVKQKLPNPLGLYDLHGNAWEWARDWYDKYEAGTFVDPEGAGKSTGWRVLRGGSFVYPPGDLRSANRFFVDPEVRSWFRYSGFRCMRVPPQH